MKLIIITKDIFFAEEAAAINLLFAWGLQLLHIRKYGASIEDHRLLIGKIKEMYHPRIVLHDCYELADEFNIGGIHHNERNGYEHKAREGLTISRSCHSLAEILTADEYDYMFLSPIFDSVSKSGYSSAFLFNHLMRAKRVKLIDERVIALGGVTLDNIDAARKCGFGGVALIGTLWTKFFRDEKNYCSLLKRFEELELECRDR